MNKRTTQELIKFDKVSYILLNTNMSTITISLPSQIAKKIDLEASKQGFATRSEFIRSLIRKYFSGNESEFEIFEPKPIKQIKLDLAKTGKYNQEFIDNVTEGLAKSSPYDR